MGAEGTAGRTEGAVSLVEVGELGDLAAAWDRLVAAAPVPSPFLRSWWLQSVADPSAHFVLAEDDGVLVGGVPLARDRWLGVDRYRFLGQGVLCPDHLDLVCLPGREADVVVALRSWFGRPGARVLDLIGLPADSLLRAAVGGVAEGVDVAPYEPLTGTADDYLAARSASFRRDLRRAERRLAEAGFEHRRVDLAGLSGTMDAFLALQEQRDGRGPLLARLPDLTRALHAGIARDEARVDVLRSPTEVAAVSIAFTTAGRLSGYQVARSLDRAHRNATVVLMTRVIDDAIAAGCHELDLLRGGEDYKSSFVTGRREVHRLRVGHGLRGRVLVSGLLAASGVRRRRSASARP